MDSFEKVEKLRERASVSYEEAKEALEHAGGDMLDAMVYLEKNGKTEGPGTGTSHTSEDISRFEVVEEKVRDEKDDAGERFAESLKRFFRTIGGKIMDNSLVLRRKGEEIFSIPCAVALIIVLLTWEWIWVVLVISLFFDCRYSFEGKDRNENANEILNRAGEMADSVKEEFQKKTG